MAEQIEVRGSILVECRQVTATGGHCGRGSGRRVLAVIGIAAVAW